MFIKRKVSSSERGQLGFLGNWNVEGLNLGGKLVTCSELIYT